MATGPRAVVACPPDELHDLPLLIFGIVLNRNGWRVDYFGASTPVDELVQPSADHDRNWSSSPPPPRIASTPILSELARLAAVAPLALAGAGATQHIADGDRCPAAHRRPRHRRPARSAGLVSAARAGRRPVVCGSDATSVSTTIPRSSRPLGRGRSSRCSCSTMSCSGRPAAPARVPLRTLRALERQLGHAGSAHSRVRRGRPEAGGPRGGRRGGCGRRPHLRRLRPLRRRARPSASPPRSARCRWSRPDRRTRSRPTGSASRTAIRTRCSPPFYRSWVANGWDAPARFDPSAVEWLDDRRRAHPRRPTISATLARRRRARRTRRVGRVPQHSARRPTATAATTQPSTAPRACRRSSSSARSTRARCSHDLGPDDDAFRRQLAWREFYATVLHHAPSTRTDLASSRTWRAWTTTAVPHADRRFACVGRRSDRLSTRRCWDAPAPGAKAGCTTGCG